MDLPCATQATMSASLSCFIFEGAAYNIIFLGRILPAVGKDVLVVPFGIIFNVVWGLALVSYARAHLADPGKLPRRWEEFVHAVGEALPLAPPRPEWQPGQATFCERCGIPRPERAHHCATCKCCVLRMDHHCAWIDNCVGFKNHKFFFLLVIYACLASVIAFATSLPEFVLCLIYLTGIEDGLGLSPVERLHNARKTDLLSFVVSGVLSLFFVVLFVPMVLTHIPMATRNETAIESNYSNMPNPFDQGSRVANVAQIFGKFGPDWIFPVQPLRPLTDGVAFPRRHGFQYGSRPQSLDELFEAEDLLPKEATEEIERVWRNRYSVRKDLLSPRGGMQAEDGPLTSLARWWSGAACARPQPVSPGRGLGAVPGGGAGVRTTARTPDSNFGSKRELALGSNMQYASRTIRSSSLESLPGRETKSSTDSEQQGGRGAAAAA